MDFPSEVAFLYDAARKCESGGSGSDGIWQLAPMFASIAYNENGSRELEAFAADVRERLPLLGAHGMRRAAKAFVRTADTITKPSYINRIQGNGFDPERTQREVLQRAYVREPSSGGLVFSVFDPRDLLMRRRPGYVPCLIAGSLLLHQRE